MKWTYIMLMTKIKDFLNDEIDSLIYYLHDIPALALGCFCFAFPVLGPIYILGIIVKLMILCISHFLKKDDLG